MFSRAQFCHSPPSLPLLPFPFKMVINPKCEGWNTVSPKSLLSILPQCIFFRSLCFPNSGVTRGAFPMDHTLLFSDLPNPPENLFSPIFPVPLGSLLLPVTVVANEHALEMSFLLSPLPLRSPPFPQNLSQFTSPPASLCRIFCMPHQIRFS